MKGPTRAEDYLEAVRYLYGRINYERQAPVPYQSRYFKLDRMRRLLHLLGDPHQGLRPIHIAGSKGKGSVATLVASALHASGYRTALFTSPHLERLEERLTVDGQSCSAETLVELMAAVRPAVDRLDQSANSLWERPTFFEIVTALAMLHFRRCQVDACVLETGLGGRLDATNVCTPSVSVITSISRDHTKQLGETLPEIAAEKAGILKPRVPAVTGVVDREPLEVIEQASRLLQSPLWRRGREFTVQPLGINSEGTTFRYRDEQGDLEMTIPLVGRHQAVNAGVALASLRLWEKQTQARHSPKIDWLSVRRRWSDVRCPARVEIVRHQPTVVLDAAHNDASVQALLKTLEETFPGRAWVVLFATSADKDAPAMLRQLGPFARQLILTRFLSNPRAADPHDLERVLRECYPASAASCRVGDDPRQAWQWAWEAACANDWSICVAGSFFLVAELRQTIGSETPPAEAPMTGDSWRSGWTRRPDS